MAKFQGRRLLITLVLFSGLGFLAHAQALFDGDWTGTLKLDGHDGGIDVRFVIQGNKVSQFFKDDDGSWSQVENQYQAFQILKNNGLYFWMNAGGIWSETQTYSLASIDAQTLHIAFLRHVNNRAQGKDGEAWNMTGSGELHKSTPGSASSGQNLQKQIDSGNWVTAQGKIYVEQGRLVLECPSEKGDTRRGQVYWSEVMSGFPNYEVSVKFRRLDGQMGSPMEIFYLGGAFAITEGGSWYFWEHVGGLFTGWKESSAIRYNQENLIRLKHVGRDVTAWVNGTLIGTYQLQNPIGDADNRVSIYMKGLGDGPTPRMAFWDFKLTQIE